MASEAQFLARGDGYSLFLTPGETIVVLKNNSTSGPARQRAAGGGNVRASSSSNLHDERAHMGDGTPAVLRMELAGANKTARLTALDELPGKSNYLIGNLPSGWHVNIPNYRKVEERGVYRGVDLDYYGTQRQLEYDFVVAPGTDPSIIRIAFQGAERMRTDSRGDLVITVAGK
jgi:hypothetical protein